MISTAIQAKCSNIIKNTFFVMGDEAIKVPYCVHREVLSDIFRNKETIHLYNWDVEVVIIHNSPDALGSYAASIISAIEGLAGTTTNNTTFTASKFEGTEPDFDTKDRLYINILKFNIDSINL
jgi:hypothetical protein